jgi:hypothetical protein
MGVLTSKLFTEGDPVTVQKLENCATGSPSEVASHFVQGQSGEHIRRVQQALKNAAETDSNLQLPPFSVNGTYDADFAKAIAAYKTKRNILNYAKRIDDIVGIKTVKSLDDDNRRHKQVDPPDRPHRNKELPRPHPPVFWVPDAEVPSSNDFTITLLMGVSGGEIAEIAKFFFAVRDTKNGLSSLYEFRGGGAGLGALPVTPAVHGKPSPFTTDQPVRVTRFGPIALMIGATAPQSVIPIPLSHTRISLSYRPDGARGLPQTRMFTLDTGDISVPGGSIHGAQFRILTRCSGLEGATPKELTLLDVGPMK